MLQKQMKMENEYRSHEKKFLTVMSCLGEKFEVFEYSSHKTHTMAKKFQQIFYRNNFFSLVSSSALVFKK